MEVLEIIGESQDLTLRQRWANVFAILLSVLLLLVGLNLRNQLATAAVLFESPQAGITAFYPQNWLLDSSSDYVFRVRDMSRSGFKTTFQVSVQPVGSDAEERNVADRLTLNRLQTFTAYQVLSQQAYLLPNDVSAQAVSYSYVSSDVSPFLQGVPTVVQGLDILTISGGQAIIITFRADADTYQHELPRFEEFLRRLQF
ncbi:MAG: hypothetical protein Q9P44_04440 [Anaerolineae bacterium]|nr:hypothetical protein [Anaerolineae bacterium]